MATIAITGTIRTASGDPAEGVVVTLTPAPPTEDGAEAISGVGILLLPVEVATDASGDFSINAESGFRYNLAIVAIGFSRDFVAPIVDVRFDLLGLVPEIESVVDFIDDTDVARNTTTIKVEDLGTVRERFDQIQLEKSTTGIGGPFTLLTTIQIEDNENFYEYTEAENNSVYYRARYFNSSNSDASQYSDPRIADSVEAAILCTVDELKELYLFGVDLTNPNTGEPYPDRMFEHYINVAIKWLEKELDIDLLAKDYDPEIQDHYAGDYGRWGWFQVDHYPVQRIDKLVFQYPSMSESVEISSEWIVLQDDGASGQVQVVPGQGNLSDVLLIPGMLFPLWSGATGRVPGVWRVSYRSGFEPGDLPDDLKHIVGMAASIGILNIAGDLVAGAGIASLSISVPGLSQSIGTTSSATNSGYGARIGEYQKEIKEALPNLRRFYGKGTRLVVP